jgi:hypothetical protein
MSKSQGANPWGTPKELKKIIKEYVKKYTDATPRANFLKEEIEEKLGDYIGGFPNAAGMSTDEWADLVVKKTESASNIDNHAKVLKSIGGDHERFTLLKGTIDDTLKKHGLTPLFSSGARTKLHKHKSKNHEKQGALDIADVINEETGEIFRSKDWRESNHEKSSEAIKEILTSMDKDPEKSGYFINEEKISNHIHLQSTSKERAEKLGYLGIRFGGGNKVYSLGGSTDNYLKIVPERDFPLVDYASKKSPELRIKVVQAINKMPNNDKRRKLKAALGILRLDVDDL